MTVEQLNVGVCARLCILLCYFLANYFEELEFVTRAERKISKKFKAQIVFHFYFTSFVSIDFF